MSEAIQTVINEFKTISPDISSTVVFALNGETIAQNEDATPEQTQTLIAKLNSITHAACIGGIKNLVIQDVSAQLAVTAVGDVYLATVSRRAADDKEVKSLTQVVAPTVIQLALGAPAKPTAKQRVPAEITEPKIEVPTPPKTAPKIQLSPPEPFQPKASTTQFMIEKITGLLVASDTVRIDSEVIEKWQEVPGSKKFAHVNVETLDGRNVTCKFKPRKDARGKILVPEKIIQALHSDVGELVIVKPVVE